MSACRFLIRKILDEPEQGDRIVALVRTMEEGITEDIVIEEDERRAFTFLLSFYQQFGRTPSIEVLEFESNFQLPECPDDPLEYWIEETINQHVKAELTRSANGILEAVRANDVTTAINCISSGYAETTTRVSRGQSIQWIESIPQQVEEHRQRQLGMLDPGILFGFPYLDRVSFGAQPGDNWALAGTKGVGKSFVAARMSMTPFDTDKRISVISMEMPKEQWARRCSALATNLSSTLLRSGRSSFIAIEVLREFERQMRAVGRNDIYHIVEGRLNMSTADVMLEIRNNRSHLVIVDGAYLLQPYDKKQRYGSRWEKSMSVMEDMRRISMHTGVPTLALFQFGRKGERKGIEGIAGTDAIGQLNSVVLALADESEGAPGMEYDPSVIPLIQYKTLDILKGREGEKGKMRLKYDMRRTSIEEDRVLVRSGSSIGDQFDNDDDDSSSIDEIFD